MKFREQVVKMRLVEKIRANTVTTSPSTTTIPEGALKPNGVSDPSDADAIGVCARCAVQIVDWKSQFYVCGEYSCAKEGKN